MLNRPSLPGLVGRPIAPDRGRPDDLPRPRRPSLTAGVPSGWFRSDAIDGTSRRPPSERTREARWKKPSPFPISASSIPSACKVQARRSSTSFLADVRDRPGNVSTAAQRVNVVALETRRRPRGGVGRKDLISTGDRSESRTSTRTTKSSSPRKSTIQKEFDKLRSEDPKAEIKDLKGSLIDEKEEAGRGVRGGEARRAKEKILADIEGRPASITRYHDRLVHRRSGRSSLCLLLTSCVLISTLVRDRLRPRSEPMDADQAEPILEPPRVIS